MGKELKELYDAKENVFEELVEQSKDINKKGRMSAGDVDTLYKLAKTHYYLCEAVEDAEDGYSDAGSWNANANMHGNYGNGVSRRGRSRNRMGQYSNDDGYSQGMDTIGEMEKLMRNAKNDKEKDAIRRCIRDMKEG